MKLRRFLLAGAGLLALGSALAIAHVRLQHPTNGNDLFWQNPGNIGIVINSTGSDNITDGSHETSLRSAIDAWNAVSGTTLNLVENTSSSQQARTDWEADNIHLILFDEDNSSGHFPGGSGTVALTPIFFFTNGRIADADILFNGQDFGFTTEGQIGFFDVQDVATHELGHFLGFDHSGYAGSTMYPFVDSTVVLHRSLASDEVTAARGAYPSGSHASIAGTVRRLSDNSVVAGAQLFARDASGYTAAGALSETDGTFSLVGLDAGTYTVYATPLDEPVDASNLSPGYVVETDFSSTVFAPVVVSAGQSVSMGDVSVDGDVTISLGRNSDIFPLRCVPGVPAAFVLRGSGLVVGSTLVASDSGVTLTPGVWSGSQVTFTVTVPGGNAVGHIDLIATDGTDVSILPGAIEVTPLSPTVSNVNPATDFITGGTALTLTGTNFNLGTRIVIGENIYVDGQPGGATVVNSTTITLTTQPTSGGTYDVVVIDSTGVEGRATDSFAFTAIPQVNSIFPVAGNSTGGTRVTITGQNFVPGVLVTINGVLQNIVSPFDPDLIEIDTVAGVAGGPHVVNVINPGGFVATAAFSYSIDPDPSLITIAPATGSNAGGDTVTLSGTDFQVTSDVLFGADPDTGLGGTPASSVVFIDSSTLEVVTPPHAGGLQSVMVQDALTSQAYLLAAAFTFQGGGGGGGGGGCHAPAPGVSSSLRQALEGGSWIAFCLLFALYRLRRGRSATN